MAPVYLLRAGTPVERELLEAQLAGEYGAGTVWPWDIHDALVRGVETLLPEGEGAELIALIRADFANALEGDEDKRKLAEVKRLLKLHWPEYRTLCMQMETRSALVPLLAFARFCVGWRNVDAPMARGIDQCLTPVALAAIDSLQLRAAGLKAYDLQYAGSAEKNSAAPLKSGADPKTSNSPADLEKDGKSPESDI